MTDQAFRFDIVKEGETYAVQNQVFTVGGFPDFSSASIWTHSWLREMFKVGLADKTRRDYLGAAILAGAKTPEKKS
jgi:hypothetical protein